MPYTFLSSIISRFFSYFKQCKHIIELYPQFNIINTSKMNQLSSHRMYRKEKTQETVNLSSRRGEASAEKRRKYSREMAAGDTSIIVNSSPETSLSKKFNQKQMLFHVKNGKQRKDTNRYLKLRKSFGKGMLLKIKSEEVLTNHISPQSKKSFSVRKKSDASIHMLQSPQCKKTLGLQSSKEEAWKPKAENYLKQTLKKTSSRLKLKVKDPFEKRTKLDNIFQDESEIAAQGQSFMSTVNQQQFREILNKLM